MRQQHRDLGVVEDVLRGAAEDNLPQPAAGEGALKDQVGAEIASLVEDDLPGRTLVGLQGSAGGRNTVSAEVGGNLDAAWAGDGVSFHGEDLDALRSTQERHAEGDCARGLRAAVPSDHDAPAEGWRSLDRGEEHGTPRLKQRRLADLA